MPRPLAARQHRSRPSHSNDVYTRVMAANRQEPVD